MNDFAKNLKTEREKRKVTQVDFAEKLGISRSYLCDLESERKSPTLKTAEKIAKACGKDLKDFI